MLTISVTFMQTKIVVNPYQPYIFSRLKNKSCCIGGKMPSPNVHSYDGLVYKYNTDTIIILAEKYSLYLLLVKL